MTTSPSTEQAPCGLRERKKARTRAAIQRQAFRLFRERGYAATTVEQIAEAAEISPSTFFRYFPSKEAVVTKNELDPAMIASCLNQPADRTPVQALRAAVRETFARLSADELAAAVERHRLTAEVPELRAASMANMATSVDLLAEIIAERTGREPGDFEVRVVAGAVLGAVMAVSLGRPPSSGPEMIDTVDRAFARLEAGFPF